MRGRSRPSVMTALPTGLGESEIPGGLWPAGVPMGEGYALLHEMPEGLVAYFDPEDDESDPEFKKCRSLKPGPQGCGGFRVRDSDYCQGHKTMIENEAR